LARSGARSIPARRALGSLERLAQELHGLRERGGAADAIERLRERGLEAIREDLRSDTAAETARIQTRFGELEHGYRKESRERSAELRDARDRASLRLAALSDNALEARLSSLAERGGADPAQADEALVGLAELRRRGDPAFDVFAKRVAPLIDRPWATSEEGRALEREADMIARTRGQDSILVEAPTANGTVALTPLGLDSLFEQVEAEAARAPEANHATV